MENKGILIVISGFSGAGKGTLVKELLRQYDEYALSVSMTTRAPRPGERDGVDYFFTTKEKFEDTIAAGGLLEYASYCGNYYGTPKAYVEEMLAAGKNVILEIEVRRSENFFPSLCCCLSHRPVRRSWRTDFAPEGPRPRMSFFRDWPGQHRKHPT